MTTPSNTDVPATPFGGFGRSPARDYRAETPMSQTPVTVPEPGSGLAPAEAADDGIMFNSFLSASSDGRRRKPRARAATVAATGAPAYTRERTVAGRRVSNRTALIAGVGLLALAGLATGAIWAMSQRQAAPVTDQAAVDQVTPGAGMATVATDAGSTAVTSALSTVPNAAPAAVAPAQVAPVQSVRAAPVVRRAPTVRTPTVRATPRAAPVAVSPEGTASTPIPSAPPSRQPEPIVITPPAEPAPVVVAPEPTPQQPQPPTEPQTSPQA